MAADVCKALEIGNSRMAMERLDDDEKGGTQLSTLGGKQEITIINEPGLYSLVLGSRKPEAKAFKEVGTELPPGGEDFAHPFMRKLRRSRKLEQNRNRPIIVYCPLQDVNRRAYASAVLSWSVSYCLTRR